MPTSLIAGIEAGGTKMLCAVARPDGRVVERARFDTVEPDATFAGIAAFFAGARDRVGPVAAGGIASFGPLDLDRASPTHGHLTGTPKPGWSGVDMLGRIAAMLDAPVAIDTDVNCAALAERRRGAARGLDRVCYVTVGTGIGVGIVSGTGLHDVGTGHPEAGHMRVARAPGDDFPGICPSHGDCVEGLACGPAMRMRWGVPAQDLPHGHVGWDHAAHYVAALCANLTYVVRPQRIVIGGGVLERPGLIDAVRRDYRRAMAGYALDRFCADADTFLVLPELRDPSAGLVGAFEIAGRAGRVPA